MKYASNRTVIVLLLLIIVSNAAWGITSYRTNIALQKAQDGLNQISQNKKILFFQKLFVDKVLKSNGDVDFKSRVDLQNAANDTKNEQVITAWEAFLEAKTEQDGQARVKELLGVLAANVY